MRWGALVYGVAGKVRFVELRYVAVRYVSAGAVRLGISCFVAIWCGRRGELRSCVFCWGTFRQAGWFFSG